MEYGLRPEVSIDGGAAIVLILVVVEYGLRLPHGGRKQWQERRLNPCCSGIWSETDFQYAEVSIES